jgi:hypothetical protein
MSMASFGYTPYWYSKSNGIKYVVGINSSASFAAASVVAAWSRGTEPSTEQKRSECVLRLRKFVKKVWYFLSDYSSPVSSIIILAAQ